MTCSMNGFNNLHRPRDAILRAELLPQVGGTAAHVGVSHGGLDGGSKAFGCYLLNGMGLDPTPISAARAPQ